MADIIVSEGCLLGRGQKREREGEGESNGGTFVAIAGCLLLRVPTVQVQQSIRSGKGEKSTGAR